MSNANYIENVKILNNDASAEMKAVLNPNSGVPFIYIPDSVRDEHALTTYTSDTNATNNKLTTLDGDDYIHIAKVNSMLTSIGMDLVYSPKSKTFILIPNIDYFDPKIDNHLIPDLNSVLIGARDTNETMGKVTYDISKEFLPPSLPAPTKKPDQIFVHVMNLPGLINRYLPNISIKPTDNLAIRFDVNLIELIELDLTKLYDNIPSTHVYRLFNHRLSKVELVYGGYRNLNKLYIPIIY